MAINLNSLGIFAKIAPAANTKGTEVVNLTADGNKISSGGTYRMGNLFGRWFRSSTSRAENNQARTKLLQALGDALGVGGIQDDGQGTLTIPDDFISRLRTRLGGDAENVLGKNDFKIKDGKVTSGRPLTERRVRAIVEKVRQLAVQEAEGQPQPELPKVKTGSIAQLQSQQNAKLLADLRYASIDQGNFRVAVQELLGLDFNEIPVQQHREINNTITMAFECGSGDRGNAVGFDKALSVLNQFRAPGKAPLTAKTIEFAAKRNLGRAEFETFGQLTSEQMLRFAEVGANHEKLKLMSETCDSKSVKWMHGLCNHGNSSTFASDVMSKVKPENRQKFLDFCIRTLGSDSGDFYNLSTLVACKFDSFADRITGDGTGFTASEAWQGIFGEPAPEGVDGLSTDDFSQRVYEKFSQNMEESLKASDEAKYADEARLKADTKLRMSFLVAVIVSEGLTLEIAWAAQTRDLSRIKIENLQGLRIYDPAKAVRSGVEDLKDQMRKDFLRQGMRITLEGQEPTNVSSDEYLTALNAHKADAERHADPFTGFWTKFEKFTAGMTDEQKLTLGYGLTQAGMELRGTLLGNGGSKEVVNEVRKDGNGNVSLKITFPANEDTRRLTYTYEIAPDGTNRIIEFKYGEE